ncbi:hypothetical protein FACS1894218_1720 [Bacilli bacterium]|nr:hypothetical protein FACS1894218_1720 [Bacilli bacterium]
MNIPLFVLGFKTIGKTFTMLTIVYVATCMVVGFIISSTIPKIQNILLLGNTIPMGNSTDI